MKNKAILEGLLFVVGEDGLTLDQIEEVLELTEDEVKSLVNDLKHSYEQEDRGLRIDFLGIILYPIKSPPSDSSENFISDTPIIFNPVRSKFSWIY